ncbi:MAG: phosphoribosylanthranilate isomerase [Pseudomonadales bacterium]|nr:phosphoribosylanthranilate isomerase [Pseudomonadales bacterium]
MSRVRVKICGITNPEDALSAVAAGADALGFVFYEKSPRYVAPEVAARICAQVPAFVAKVGLFVDHDETAVRNVISSVELELLQFHGNETESYCKQFDRPYIKAVRVNAENQIRDALAQYPSAKNLLLDAYVKGVPGGTGQKFDWGLIPAELAHNVILAGGLDPQNVAEAVSMIKPYAVDVSGGVEQAKGIKNQSAVQEFIKEVWRAQNVY